MKENLTQFLLSLGLSEQRAKLYLACLSLGKGTAPELAEAVKLGRTTVYDNLDYLQEKGLLRVVHDGKRKTYIPLHPKELYKQIANQKDQLKDLLPDFLAIFATQTKEPFVQVFTGANASREIYEDILQVAPKEYVYFSAPFLTWKTVDKKYMREWIDRRIAKKIHSRGLRVKHHEIPDIEWLNAEEQYLRKIRYLPEYLDLKNSIYIYGNNIGVISTQEENSSFIIYSPDLSYSLKQIFEFLWQVSLRA